MEKGQIALRIEGQMVHFVKIIWCLALLGRDKAHGTWKGVMREDVGINIFGASCICEVSLICRQKVTQWRQFSTTLPTIYWQLI